MAVSYEPIEGTLCCRFKSREEPYIYLNVPENIYQVLLKTPFASAYFRKQVKGKYPMLGENLPEQYRPIEKPLAKILKTIEVLNPEMNLFGEAIRRRSRIKKPTTPL